MSFRLAKKQYNSEMPMNQTQSNSALIAAQNYEKNVVTYTTAPFAAILLEYAKPQPGEQVLDVACGTGIVARQTASRVGGSGTIVGVDLNPAMLAVARSLPAPEGASIDWREGSALALPLPDETFDLVLCQAGLQFLPDRHKALREMFRVLRTGGRAAISVWRSIEHNPAGKIIWEAIARHLNTTVLAINPAMSLGDRNVLRSLLESAGFAEVTIVARSYTVRQPRNPQLVTQKLASVAGFLPALAALTMEERAAMAQAVESEIAPAFQKYVEGEEEIYPTSAHIAIARKL
jgi:ubiquinone/menaquinone biosynthesis C-methylase UbiE